MCGIAGIIGKDVNLKLNEVENMLRAIKHRGPDGNGIERFENAILGHLRLSIVDIEGGVQPMYNYLKTHCITFNGEIYGYQTLKQQYGDYPYQSKSDTELILAMYQKDGIDMLKKMTGMFSFGIWDQSNNSFFAARDRFGEKPFFYTILPLGNLAFASEIKALLTLEGIDKSINYNALAGYFKTNYIQSNESIFKNIKVLKPAHYLIYKNGILEEKPYWHLPKTNYLIKEDEAVYKFQSLLDQSVKNQLVADVKVSTFLSGGLDSSTITALSSQYAKDIQCLSFGFGDSINELPFAKQVADKFGLSQIQLDSGTFDIAELIVKMGDIYDEPLADSSTIPTYLICKEAKKHSTVVLTGDGGDELLAGYTEWYGPSFQLSQLIDGKWGKFSSTLINHVLKGNKKATRNQLIGFKQFLIGNKTLDYKRLQLSIFDNESISQLLDKSYNYKEIIPKSEHKDSFRFFTDYDILNYMPADILVKTDRAAMANSLELRAPFLDVEFAEFCISLPSNFKINSIQNKLILRKAFDNKLPSTILNRKKQGFGSPIHQWLKLTNVNDIYHQIIQNKNSKIHQIINIKNPETYSDSQKWQILTLGIWANKWL